jgi:D-arabinose 5-phosphate isomerase GutQ
MTDFVTLVAASFSGATVTVLAVVSIGSRLEDRAATLRGAPPGPVAAAARRIIGLYVRMPAQQTQASPSTRADKSRATPDARLVEVLQWECPRQQGQVPA